MKYFRVQFVSQKTMHSFGHVCLEHTVAAETKAATKSAALEFLRTEDDANCMYYKAPRLEEITAERYTELTRSDDPESAASDIDLYLACLVIFGEHESYDEDELLAMPELYGAYTELRNDLHSVLAVCDGTPSAGDARKEALSLYQLGKPSDAPEVDAFDLSTKSVDKRTDNAMEIHAKAPSAAEVHEVVKKQSNIDTRSTKFWQQHPPVAGQVLGGGSRVFTGLPNETYHAADGYSSTQIRLALAWYKDAPRKREESTALALGAAVHTSFAGAIEIRGGIRLRPSGQYAYHGREGNVGSLRS